MERLKTGLTSLAPGGLVRARLEDGECPEVGSRVLAFDDLAETQVEATVDHVRGAFAYLKPDWDTTRDYLPISGSWSWADVYLMTMKTPQGDQGFERHGLGEVEDPVTLVLTSPMLFPGMSVTISEESFSTSTPPFGGSATVKYRGPDTVLGWWPGGTMQAQVYQMYAPAQSLVLPSVGEIFDVLQAAG